MSKTTSSVNESPSGPTAPLRNVQLFWQLMEKLIHRPRHLPGLGVFYGFSGYGKTHSAVFAANRTNAYYIEAGASWHSTQLVDAIYHEMTGSVMKGSVAAKVSEIINLLSSDMRPLIIDEADHLIKKSIIDIVREIADRTWMPVILIGEEALPRKLEQFERSHNRVLDFQAAEPCNLDDAKALSRLYLKDLKLDDALLKHIVNESDGVTRRICINLERVNEFARREGVTDVTMQLWGERVLFHGRPEPRRRSFGRQG